MKSTLTVVVGDMSTAEWKQRQREAKAAQRLDYVVVITPTWIRVYFFGKAQGALKRWNGTAPWVSARTRAAVVAKLQEMGWTGEIPPLPLTSTNPKG